jgi:hypothetical protein
VWVELGSNGQGDECDLGGRSLVRERSPHVLDNDDEEEGVGPSGKEPGLCCGTLLEHVRARLQNLAPNPFDQDDLK